jgi:hypothetical protein
MRQALAASPFVLLAIVIVLWLGGFAVRAGLMPDDSLTLWASAVTASGGDVPIGRILAGYPTIPFLATTLLETVLPARTPTPALLAALLLGSLAGGWFLAFRNAGLTVAVSAAFALLLAFHPALLRAAVSGPAEMFLVLFLAMLANGLYDLRARSSTPQVMAVGLALLGLAFSHPMGAAIACAVTPLLVFAVRPVLIATSALNVVVALVFPTVFCVGAFIYMAWVFPGHGWSFLAAPAESLATWVSGVSRVLGFGISGMLAIMAGVSTLCALALGAPLAPYALALIYRRRPLIAPAGVLIAALVIAAVVAVITGLFGDPAVLLTTAPVLAAVMIARIPVVRERLGVAAALLVAGWIGGTLAIAIADPSTASHIRAAIQGGRGDRERADALLLGGATIGKTGVLVDTFNAPAVVLGRGGARGLVPPSDEAFSLALMFARLDARYVAVPNPQTASGAGDRLNKTFPALYWRGAPGYRLVYQNESWRLFAREAANRSDARIARHP